MVALEINNQTNFRISAKKIGEMINLAQKMIKQVGKKNVSIGFVSPARISKLNSIYRHKNKVTDVLSFEGEKGSEDLGEIIVCSVRAQKQAKEFKHSFSKEVNRLLLHGYLHLCGYDHIKNAEAVVMEALEEKIMNKMYA